MRFYPINYTGNKKWLTSHLLSCIPENTKTICSPFVGGAYFEVTASQKIKVFGYDVNNDLCNFWDVFINNRALLFEHVRKNAPISHGFIRSLEHRYFKNQMPCKIEQAFFYYVSKFINYLGVIRQNPTLIDKRIKNHNLNIEKDISLLTKLNTSNFSVKCLDFQKSIPKHKDAFLYLDPPYFLDYDVKRYYSIEKFDHLALFNILNSRDNWVLSYNKCNFITDLYKNYGKTIHETFYRHLTKDKRESKYEYLIFSHDIRPSKTFTQKSLF